MTCRVWCRCAETWVVPSSCAESACEDDLGTMTIPEAQVAEIVAAIAMEARQGGNNGDWSHPKDDSAGRQASPTPNHHSGEAK